RQNHRDDRKRGEKHQHRRLLGLAAEHTLSECRKPDVQAGNASLPVRKRLSGCSAQQSIPGCPFTRVADRLDGCASSSPVAPWITPADSRRTCPWRPGCSCTRPTAASWCIPTVALTNPSTG